MNFQSIKEWLSQKFHFMFLVIAVVCLLFLFFTTKSCFHPVHDTIDSTKTTVIVRNDSSKIHRESDSVRIVERVVFKTVYVPTVKDHYIVVDKTNKSDSCSPVIINKIFQRTDGGYATLYAIVDCRNSILDTVSIAESAIRADTIVSEYWHTRYVMDSVAFIHIRDSIESTYKTHHENLVLSVTGTAQYDFILSHAFTAGLGVTIPVNNKWDLLFAPQLSIVPGLSPMLQNLLQLNVGIQYHFLDVKS